MNKKIRLTEEQFAKVVLYIKEGDASHSMKQNFVKGTSGMSQKFNFVEGEIKPLTENTDEDLKRLFADQTRTPEELIQIFGGHFSVLVRWIEIHGNRLQQNYGDNWLSKHQVQNPVMFYRKLVDGSITPEMIDKSGIKNFEGQPFSELPVFKTISPYIDEIRNRMQPKQPITRELGVDPTIESKISGGHPVMGTGGHGEYKPQAEKKNIESFKSFNKVSESATNSMELRQIGEEIKKLLKDIAINKDEFILPASFKKFDISRDKLIKHMEEEFGLIDRESGVIAGVNFSNIKRNIQRLAKYLKAHEIVEYKVVGDMDEASHDYAPDPSDFLHQAPWNQPSLGSLIPKKYKLVYQTVYLNNEIAILKNDIGEYFVFYYGNIDKSELYPDIKSIEQGEDGPEYEYDLDSFEINEDRINAYVNTNLNTLKVGSGIDSFEEGKDDLVKIDSELAAELIRVYKSDTLAKILHQQPQNEETVAGAPGTGLGGGGSSGPFTADLNGGDVIKRPIAGVTEGKKMIKKDGSAVKLRRKKYNYKEATSKTRKCRRCDNNTKGKCKIIWGSIDSNYVCDAFKTKDVDEMDMSVSNPSGSYETPKMWAGSKKDHANSHKSHLMYPGGSFVESIKRGLETLVAETNNLTDTSYPDGEFVEFDDCVRLNNNKKAQEGGCSAGAVDNVVKTKKSKASVISKDGKYNRGD